MRRLFGQDLVAESLAERSMRTKIGLFGKIFGCWHKDLSRPFSTRIDSYRVCLECGARKEFDIKSFKTLGTFYYPPSVSFDRN